MQRANELFNDYQKKTTENPTMVIQEQMKWQAGDKELVESIRTKTPLTLKKAAKYADYVCRFMIHEGGDNLEEFIKEQLEAVDVIPLFINSCIVGNLCALTIAYGEKHDDDFYKKHKEKLETYLHDLSQDDSLLEKYEEEQKTAKERMKKAQENMKKT